MANQSSVNSFQAAMNQASSSLGPAVTNPVLSGPTISSFQTSAQSWDIGRASKLVTSTTAPRGVLNFAQNTPLSVGASSSDEDGPHNLLYIYKYGSRNGESQVSLAPSHLSTHIASWTMPFTAATLRIEQEVDAVKMMGPNDVFDVDMDDPEDAMEVWFEDYPSPFPLRLVPIYDSSKTQSGIARFFTRTSLLARDFPVVAEFSRSARALAASVSIDAGAGWPSSKEDAARNLPSQSARMTGITVDLSIDLHHDRLDEMLRMGVMLGPTDMPLEPVSREGLCALYFLIETSPIQLRSSCQIYILERVASTSWPGFQMCQTVEDVLNTAMRFRNQLLSLRNSPTATQGNFFEFLVDDLHTGFFYTSKWSIAKRVILLYQKWLKRLPKKCPFIHRGHWHTRPMTLTAMLSVLLDIIHYAKWMCTHQLQDFESMRGHYFAFWTPIWKDKRFMAEIHALHGSLAIQQYAILAPLLEAQKQSAEGLTG
ncbi:hypothetical protein Hypma_009811 [Hypsizygus marmoreus]|uniref:Uncharacterized protein n=1 Tax=Hypsizygus marmoreus TaxID=39966 RepID=A0A369JUA2_HYPMA|nr:hypothetical protein Hypma_009811 [Hypsizygus marmoreus]